MWCCCKRNLNCFVFLNTSSVIAFPNSKKLKHKLKLLILLCLCVGCVVLLFSCSNKCCKRCWLLIIGNVVKLDFLLFHVGYFVDHYFVIFENINNLTCSFRSFRGTQKLLKHKSENFDWFLLFVLVFCCYDNGCCFVVIVVVMLCWKIRKCWLFLLCWLIWVETHFLIFENVELFFCCDIIDFKKNTRKIHFCFGFCFSPYNYFLV